MISEESKIPEKELSAREVTIMKCVWKMGECTAEEVRKQMKKDYGLDLQLNTVHTFLRNIMGKGYLIKRKRGIVCLFKASETEEECRIRHIRNKILLWYGDDAKEQILEDLNDWI